MSLHSVAKVATDLCPVSIGGSFFAMFNQDSSAAVLSLVVGILGSLGLFFERYYRVKGDSAATKLDQALADLKEIKEERDSLRIQVRELSDQVADLTKQLGNIYRPPTSANGDSAAP